MKISINLKFFLYLSLIFLILFSVSGLLYLDQYKSGLENKLTDEGSLIVRLLNLVIVNDVVNYNDISLISNIEKIESVDNVLYAMILSGKGVVLGHSDVYQIGKVYNDKLSKWATSLRDFSCIDSIQNGKSIMVCAAPVIDKSLGNVAYILFGLSKNVIDDGIQKERKKMLTFVIIFYLLFIVVFFVLFYYEISKPISMIKDGVRLMKDQFSNFKFKLHQKDEIGDVYEGINTLVSQVVGALEERNSDSGKIFDAEQKRLEKVILSLHEYSDILIADNDNKIIFSRVSLTDFISPECNNMHIIDALKNSDLVSIVTDAYSNKKDMVKGEINFGMSKYIVNVFSLQDEFTTNNKIILIINKQ